MWNVERTRAARHRWAAPAACAALLLLLAAASPARGADDESALRQRIEAAYDVLPLRGGVILRPHAEGGPAAIEVRDGEVAVDGRLQDREELADLLGEDAADDLEALSELDHEELSSLFDLGATEPAMEAPEPPEPPEAPEPPTPPKRPRVRKHSHGSGQRVIFGSPAIVEEDEEVGEVVAIGGKVTVRGKVDGDAVAVGGSATIDGEVAGDVVSVGGGVRLGPGAHVSGDVVSVGGRVHQDPDAQVDGEINEVSLWTGLPWRWSGGSWGRTLGRVGRFDYFEGSLEALFGSALKLAIFALMGALLVVLAHGPMERVAARVAAEPWKAGAVGLASYLLFLPVLILVVLLLCISIIGIPLLLLVPFAILAFCVLAFFGYLAVAYRLGRWSEVRFGWKTTGPIVALVIGLLFLHGWGFFSNLVDVLDGPRDLAGFFSIMLLLFGIVVQLAAWSVGLGGVLLARTGARGGAVALPPLPPPPPAAEAGDEASEPPAAPTAEDGSAEAPDEDPTPR